MRDLIGVVGVKEMLRVLKPLKAVCPTGKRTLPVLNSVRVEAAPEDGGVWMEATNLDVRLSLLASGDAEASARPGFINPRRVTRLLKHWPGSEVTLDVGRVQGAMDDHDVGLTGPGIRTRLRTPIREDEWPSSLSPEWEWEASIPWEPLRRMAGKTVWACSTEESRPILNGVYWAHEGSSDRVCGTNGHRLACMEIDDLSEVGLPDFEIIVPPGFWRTAFQVFGSEDEVLTLKMKGGKFIALESPTARLYARLIEGRYPNYRQVLPSKDKDRVRVSANRAELEAATKRANAVASNQTHRMVAEIEDDHLTLRVWTPDIGELVQVVPAEVEIPEGMGGFTEYRDGRSVGTGRFRVGVNAEYLIEAIRYTSGPTIDMAFTAAERGFEVTSEEDPAWTCLVMPLRLIDSFDGGLLAEPPLEELAEAEGAAEDAEEEAVPA